MFSGDDIKRNISKNIVKYREKSGLSQKELAQKLKTTSSRISNWEQGANCPTIDILFEVCKILNVSINDIYGVYPDSEISLSYDEQEHIKKYRNLDLFGQETIDYILDRETERVREIRRQSSIIREAEVYKEVSLDEDYLMVNAAHDKSGATEEEKEADNASMDDEAIWKK